ncbi:hypothetical protein CDAR_556921 [Caerostris darwini]|uniref:Uncharacterized protein n=1 Tax=Caerostris darwini TaxID=1538125 RepID=A0AAV4QJU2_9ARAC|nr:hypothetical protein CDAR_556921 [Caerostris darwini]
MGVVFLRLKCSYQTISLASERSHASTPVSLSHDRSKCSKCPPIMIKSEGWSLLNGFLLASPRGERFPRNIPSFARVGVVHFASIKGSNDLLTINKDCAMISKNCELFVLRV